MTNNYYKKLKIFTLLIVCTIFTLSAQTQQRVTMNLKDVTLTKVLKVIESQTTYRFSYKNKNIDNAKDISIKCQNEFVDTILNKILQKKGLGFKIISEKSIGITKLRKKVTTESNNKIIKGQVTDSNGEAIIGAAISVKGSTGGTISDFDGNFTLNAPENATLKISYIGYINQEIDVKGKNTLSLILTEDTNKLDEVIVVGYGTQKKTNLTGAVTQISGDALENRPIVNISQGLQGVIPNLNINLNSGAPGQSSSFNIRGTTSLNGGSPLILVDNVQMDPDLINPEDVASISVLKDAASSAIYGAKAAYGVILITTKSGSKEQRPKVSFSANGYWQSPAKKIETLNSLEMLKMKDIAYRNSGGSGHYYNPAIYEYTNKYVNGTWKDPVFFDANIDPSKYQYCGNTNWWDEIYKKSSFSEKYNVSINGGTAKTSYYISVGMNKMNGLLKAAKDNYKKYNAKVNVSTDVTKWLTASANVIYNHTREKHPSGGISQAQSRSNTGLSTWSGYLKNDLTPLMPVRHPDGNFSGQGNYTNPVAVQSLSGNTNIRQNDIWLTGGLKITPFKELVVNADYSFNTYNKNNKTHVRKYLDHTAVPGTENYYPWTNPNSVVMSTDENYYSTFNLFATYTKSIKNRHNFKATMGYNYEYKHNRYYYGGRKDLIDNNNPSLNLASGKRMLDASETHWGVKGYFFRLTYNYDQKYLFEVNGRYDGSSKFPTDNRYAFFPSVSAAWRISEEAFWKDFGNVWNDMKIRASYGSLGNQVVGSLGNFPYLSNYGVNTALPYMLNRQLPVAITPSGLVSPTFTWETVQQFNVGFDVALFNKRLALSFDYYRRDTKDMLSPGQTLPAVLGVKVPNENAADLMTTGYELSISWMDHFDNGFNYWIKGALSDYQSKITRFSNPINSLNTHYVGQHLNEIWGYRSKGLFTSEDDVKNSPSQLALWSGKWAPGDVKYQDLNGDNKIDWGDNSVNNPGDKVIIGNSTPRYSFGFTAGFEYKNFDFEMFLQGIAKRDYMCGGAHFWGYTSQWDTPLKSSLNYWTEDNKDAYFPRPSWNNDGNRQTGDRYLQNAAYMRLKNITIGYTVPKIHLEKLFISKLRFFVSGENLFTITDLIDSFDPETLNNQTYPILKKYAVGFNLTF